MAYKSTHLRTTLKIRNIISRRRSARFWPRSSSRPAMLFWDA